MDVAEAEDEGAEPQQDVNVDMDVDMSVDSSLSDEMDDDNKPVVRPEQPAQVSDVGPSFALLPVSDIFGAVVRFYTRKPRAVSCVVVSARFCTRARRLTRIRLWGLPYTLRSYSGAYVVTYRNGTRPLQSTCGNNSSVLHR